VLHSVLAVLALLVAAAPAPRTAPATPTPASDRTSSRPGFAYDASSPRQVFVGLPASAD
jgi:hypothetical protein